MDVDRMTEQYRQAGATEADIERAGLNDQGAKAREGIIVLQPNWPVFLLFLAVSNQWQQIITPTGKLIKTGLDWVQVETRARHVAEIRDLDETETDTLWRDLTTMQNTALECMAELRDDG